MSIEVLITNLTAAIEANTAALTGGKRINVKSLIDETPGAVETKQPSSDAKLAGKKTYVWNVTTKTGQIIEKGQPLPEMDDEHKAVQRTAWDKACEKYGCDPETGEEIQKETESDDLDGLGDDTPNEDELAGGADDDGLDLGLDDEPAKEPVTREDVKKVLVKLNQEVGKEAVMKLLKKYGAANFGQLKEDDLEDAHADATDALDA